MLVRPNLKNIVVFLLGSFFFYLAFLIWNAKEGFPPIDVELRDLVSYIVLATEMGGIAVSRVYYEGAKNEKPPQVYKKKGQMDVGRAELLTRADLISNAIMLGLLKRFPLLNVVSEEAASAAEISPREVERYRSDNYEIWMGLRELISNLPSWRVPLDKIVIWIDPLDGTQEFTEGLTEYVTVMACIAIDGKPFVGAIHSPFGNETILGMVDRGVFSSKNGAKLRVGANNQHGRHAELQNKTLVVSRSHAGSVSHLINQAFSDQESPHYTIEAAGGAGYKTLRLVQGTADLYLHTTNIKKWDICAGDAITKAAGGALLSLGDGLPLDYSVERWSSIGGRTKVEGGGVGASGGGGKLKFEPVHKEGILMALDSPYSVYERVKKKIRNF